MKTGIKVLLTLLLGAAPAAAQDAAAGEALYGPCAACHGPGGGGNKDLNAPAIGGQEQWYLIRQLQNFKSGVRGAGTGDTFGAQMVPMAGTVADEQAAKNLAAYIATLGG